MELAINLQDDQILEATDDRRKLGRVAERACKMSWIFEAICSYSWRAKALTTKREASGASTAKMRASHHPNSEHYDQGMYRYDAVGVSLDGDMDPRAQRLLAEMKYERVYRIPAIGHMQSLG